MMPFLMPMPIPPVRFLAGMSASSVDSHYSICWSNQLRAVRWAASCVLCLWCSIQQAAKQIPLVQRAEARATAMQSGAARQTAARAPAAPVLQQRVQVRLVIMCRDGRQCDGHKSTARDLGPAFQAAAEPVDCSTL